MEGATEKIKNYQRFLYWLIEYMPKKEPKKISWDTPFKWIVTHGWIAHKEEKNFWWF